MSGKKPTNYDNIPDMLIWLDTIEKVRGVIRKTKEQLKATRLSYEDATALSYKPYCMMIYGVKELRDSVLDELKATGCLDKTVDLANGMVKYMIRVLYTAEEADDAMNQITRMSSGLKLLDRWEQDEDYDWFPEDHEYETVIEKIRSVPGTLYGMKKILDALPSDKNAEARDAYDNSKKAERLDAIDAGMKTKEEIDSFITSKKSATIQDAITNGMPKIKNKLRRKVRDGKPLTSLDQALPWSITVHLPDGVHISPDRESQYAALYAIINR